LPESDRAYIGVWSPGKMSTIKNFTVAKNSSPVVDVAMKSAGKPLKIKIVDKDGKPIKGYYICIERWGEHRLVNPILQTGKESRARTDENGYWIWKEAPENEVVFDMFIGPSIMDLRNKPMTARDEEYVFTAFPALKITGEVLDDTEQPMPTFKVFLGFQFENSSDYHWELQANAGKDGVYSIAENYPQAGFAVKIEAEGYEPAISRNITPDEGKITIDFSLQKLSAEKASQTLQGTVLTPDGKPATNATVVMATSKQHQMIDNGRIQGREPYAIKTDKEGKFKFAYIDFKKERRSDQNFPSDVKVSDYSICILHDSGFCRLSQNEMETTFKEKPIALEKWGRIEGTVYKGTKPAENVRLMFAPRFSEQGSSTWEPMVSWHNSVLSDGNGQFVFKQVPAVSGLVQQGVPIGKSSVTYTGGMKIDVRPGETTTVKIGGDGRPVTGKLISGGFETPPDWSFCTITCAVAIEKPDFTAMSKLADMLPFSIKAELDPAKKKELLEEWMNTTDEGKAYSEAFQVFNAKMREYYEARQGSSTKPCGVSEDGTFRLDDVSEGDWQIEVELKSPPPPGQFWSNTIIGKLEHRFTMDAIPNGVSDEPLDLGTLTIEKIEQPKPLLQVGQTTPDFELAQIFATTDTEAKKDAKLRLSDYKGKIIVLDFWATWCVPCLQKMPELRKLHESLKGNPRVVMIGISFDNKEAAESLGKFVTEKDMPWLHALAGNLLESKTAKDYGVSGIPALLLIGTDGKVLLSNPNIEEVAKKIEEMK
jgi:thiol-disulfide isomerase/thioredoxin